MHSTGGTSTLPVLSVISSARKHSEFAREACNVTEPIFFSIFTRRNFVVAHKLLMRSDANPIKSQCNGIAERFCDSFPREAQHGYLVRTRCIPAIKSHLPSQFAGKMHCWQLLGSMTENWRSIKAFCEHYRDAKEAFARGN